MQHSGNKPQTQLDRADSDTSNWPQVGEDELSATCSHPNLSEPGNKGSNNCIKTGDHKRAKSWKSEFTNTGNPLHLFQCYHTACSRDRHYGLLLAPCTAVQQNFNGSTSAKRIFPLTVQLCRDIINNTLLRVRVLNRWIIIRYKVTLKILKQTNQYNLQQTKSFYCCSSPCGWYVLTLLWCSGLHSN